MDKNMKEEKQLRYTKQQGGKGRGAGGGKGRKGVG